jgi:pantothenate kinase-related protein Tda10
MEEGALNAATATDQSTSTILQVMLPKTGNQVAKRIRIEQKQYLMVRQPIFMQYEHAVFEEDDLNFIAMTGPQGFGKSVFLHYLATK